MRGKHGKAAQARRDWASLEQRATTSEQCAERLEKELAGLRETSQRQISGLRSELAQARKDRDATAAPALAQAEEKIRVLMIERDAANDHAKQIGEKWGAHLKNLGGVLKGIGLTGLELTEVLQATVMPDAKVGVIAMDEPKTSKRSAEMVLAVQIARGKRHSADHLAAIRATD